MLRSFSKDEKQICQKWCQVLKLWKFRNSLKSKIRASLCWLISSLGLELLIWWNIKSFKQFLILFKFSKQFQIVCNLKCKLLCAEWYISEMLILEKIEFGLFKNYEILSKLLEFQNCLKSQMQAFLWRTILFPVWNKSLWCTNLFQNLKNWFCHQFWNFVKMVRRTLIQGHKLSKIFISQLASTFVNWNDLRLEISTS